MKRLIRKSNHVGPMAHEDVNKDVLDNERTKRRESSTSFLMAKQIAMDLEITPTNENILAIMNDIDGGKYADLGKSKEHWDQWINRTRDLFREKHILIAKKNR